MPKKKLSKGLAYESRVIKEGKKTGTKTSGKYVAQKFLTATTTTGKKMAKSVTPNARTVSAARRGNAAIKRTATKKPSNRRT